MIGGRDRQGFPQVGIPRLGRRALGSPGAAHRALALPSHLTHQPGYRLAVDRDLFAVQQGGAPPVPRGGPCLGEARHGCRQPGLFPGARLVIIAAPLRK